MTRFGTIFDASQLEDAATKFLQKWWRTYAAEVAEQSGFARGTFPNPLYWTTTPALTPAGVEQVRYPAVLIVSPGLIEQPRRAGDGTYQGTYSLGVTVLTTGDSELSAGVMAKRYGSTVHTAMLQKPSLETTFVESIDWVDERFTDYLNAENETLSSATEIFNVTVKDILKASGGLGPTEPDPEPEPHDYGDWPTVKDFRDGSYNPVDIERVDIDGQD